MKTIFEHDDAFLCDIQAPCFQLLSMEEMEIIRSSKTQVLFRKGDTISKQGAFSTYILFVIKGFVKQYLEGLDDKTFNLRIVRPGEFVGLSSVFTQQVFSYSSIALTECQAILIDTKTVSEIAQQNGMFSFNITKRYYQQNASLYDVFKKVMFKQMNGRLAETLLYLSSERFSDVDIFPLLTRKDVADFAGMSTESAVKSLKIFESDGLIKLKDKHVEILNKESLQDISLKG